MDYDYLKQFIPIIPTVHIKERSKALTKVRNYKGIINTYYALDNEIYGGYGKIGNALKITDPENGYDDLNDSYDFVHTTYYDTKELKEYYDKLVEYTNGGDGLFCYAFCYEINEFITNGMGDPVTFRLFVDMNKLFGKDKSFNIDSCFLSMYDSSHGILDADYVLSEVSEELGLDYNSSIVEHDNQYTTDDYRDLRREYERVFIPKYKDVVKLEWKEPFTFYEVF